MSFFTDIGLMGAKQNIGDKRRRNAAEKLTTLMGQPAPKVTSSGSMTSYVPTMVDGREVPMDYRSTVDPESVRFDNNAASGYLGSEKTPEDLSRLTGEMVGAGFDPVNIRTMVQPMLNEQAASDNLVRDKYNSYYDLMEEQQKNMYENTNGLDIKDLTGINNQVTSMTKEVANVHQAAKTLEGLKKRGTPAAQTAAVFAFMKSIDPTSTVRESELGMVYSAEGAGAQMAAMMNKMLGEGALTASNFSDLVDTSKGMANTAIDAQQNRVDSFLDVYGDRMKPNTRNQIGSRLPKKFAAPQVAPRQLSDAELDAAIAREQGM